jgi:hypothetical protein
LPSGSRSCWKPPGITVVEVSGTGDSFVCPIGEALWMEYRKRNPNGLTIPTPKSHNTIDPELLPYLRHVGGCNDCY